MLIKEWFVPREETEKAVYFRTDFEKKFEKYIIRITALGVFKIYINGQTVSTDELSPGWKDYTKKVPIVEYDISERLRDKNGVGIIVGQGWASSDFEFGELKKYYNVKKRHLFAQIIGIESGKECIQKCKWTYSYGGIGYNDILHGEYFDENNACYGFSKYGSYDNWKECDIVTRPIEGIDNYDISVSVHEEFIGERVLDKPHKQIFDFKQNFSGIVKLVVEAKTDCTITVRHGEMLENGELYVNNLRTAKATDVYKIKKGHHELRPYFTYHGFRYSEIAWEGEMEISQCKGLALYVDEKFVGNFECSSKLVNRIYQNCLWSLKSNFVFIQTDCPQRDERLGWLGDAGVFALSSMYSVDCRKYFDDYLSTIVDEIKDDGAIPCLAPISNNFLSQAVGASGWADSFITIIYDYYKMYGDKTIINKYVKYAENFIKWIENNSVNYERNTYCFSDWLSINSNYKEGYGDVERKVFDLFYYAIDCKIMIELYHEIGKDSSEYQRKYDVAKEYFFSNYYKKPFVVGNGKQTSLMLAYKAGFLDLEQIKQPFLEEYLNDGLVSGFIGTKYLLSTLVDVGRSDLAYKLICSTDYPSWGYEIQNGATTIWERWDSYSVDKGFNSHGMNSFNHFCFGSCLEWFFSYVLGIKPYGYGFEKIKISPTIDISGNITSASGSYRVDDAKLISVKWETQKDKSERIATVEIDYCKTNDVCFEINDWDILDEVKTPSKIIIKLRKQYEKGGKL